MDNSGAQVKKCVLLGAGGHARVVLDALLLQQPELEPVIIDINPAIKELMGFPVQQMALSELCGNGITHYVIGVGSVGAVGRRRKLQAEAESLGWHPLRVIHPSAVVARDVELGDGVQIMAGVVVNAGTMIGAQAILNTGAVIEHECRVGAFAHIAPRAVLAGGVVVEQDAHVGMGAMVKEGGRIGEKGLIGAGAVVLKDVPALAVMVGVPARLLRMRQL